MIATKKHRAVLVGCGSRSHTWLTALQNHYSDQVEMVGLVDLNPALATDRSQQFEMRGAWTGTCLDKALRETQAEVVFNLTVPGAHVASCETALRAGCHVLVEKPLAPSVSEGRQLRQLAGEKNRILAVAQNRRHLPGAITVRDAISSGIIGAVQSLHVDFFRSRRGNDFRQTMESPLLLDMAIHTFDQCRHLCGLDATRVTCHEWNPTGSWFAHGGSAVALFEMTNGAVFSYRGSWCTRGHSTSWAGSWRITGERGTLLWDGEDRIEVERVQSPWDGLTANEPVERFFLPPILLSADRREHVGNIGEFIDCLNGGKLPQTVAADNLHSLAMVETAIASARQGKSIVIAPEGNS